jgi:hypothetical protein
MAMQTIEKERVLVAVDPVRCGQPALERALGQLDPDRQALTVLVVAKTPPGRPPGATHPTGFEYSDSALTAYRRTAEVAGFEMDGWVTPERRDQIVREIEASGPYDRALALSPSGVWQRLKRQDTAQLLEKVGIETSLQCVR